MNTTFLILTSFFCLSAFAQDNNDWVTDREANNCYNYAVGIKSDSNAIPGRFNNPRKIIYNYSCKEVTEGALEDGLKFIGSKKKCPVGQRLIALAIYPKQDFHWYYYNLQDKTWWSKAGASLPSNLDASKNVIKNPATANRMPYTEFCGYFCVDLSKVDIW